MEKREYAFVVN